MAPVTTKGLVAAALGGNALAAAGKIVAYALTGSSALLSEAIHSLVAITHQILLLFGVGQANRPADARHAFGHARELYFWSFIAAILLFSHGAGVAIYEGIQKLKNPPFLSISAVSYGALLVALVVQSVLAYMLFKDRAAGAVSRDPARAALSVETLAALAGVTIALAGLLATDQLGFRYGDAIASLGVGFVMAAVAVVMCLRVRRLIVGEAANPALRSRLRTILQAETGPGRPLSAVHEIRTLHIGADDVLVAAYVQFREGETARTIEATTSRLERSIKAEAADISHVFVVVQQPDDSAGQQPDDMAEPEIEPEAPDLEQELDAVLSEPRPPATPAPLHAKPAAQSGQPSRKGRKRKRRH